MTLRIDWLGGIMLVEAIERPHTKGLRPVARVERIAMLTVHSSPLATIGSKDAGGMNVYVRELARQMDSLGVAVDIFTRRSDAHTKEIQHISPCARVISITAGPAAPLDK